jgi:phosphatidate cytidylyltransferase
MSDSTPTKINPGRNLPVATVVGLLLLGLLVASLSFDSIFFLGFASVAAIGAIREFVRMGVVVSSLMAVVYVGVVAILVAAFFGGMSAALLVFVATAAIILTLRLTGGNDDYTRDVSTGIFVVLYVGVLLGFATDLAAASNPVGYILTLVLLTAANDTGGYFAGILAGKHPMVPAISPKKTWEGFAGSLALQVVIGYFAIPALIDVVAWQGALLGVLMTFTATVGDIVESAIKRDRGIKDSGSSIPGHGGFLDRLDSILFNAPVAWFAITMWWGLS